MNPLSQLRSPRVHVPVLLAIALLLRLVLVAQGGQYYFGDEERYNRGVALYQALVAGDVPQVRTLAALPEHALFPWLTALVTAGQHLLAQFTPHGDWTQPQNVAQTMWLGAALLALFSVLNLWLVHRLALVAGAGEAAAGWALLLMAASNTAFYHARHLLPYDCAISAALLAMIIGVRSTRPVAAWTCGLLVCATYGLYNGYWFLVPVIWLVHAVTHRCEPNRWRLMLGSALGTATGLLVPIVVGATLGGDRYWAALRSFSRSVTLGRFDEAWSLPWEYLWHAEGALGVAVVLAIAGAALRHWRQRSRPAPWVGLTTLAFAGAYLLLLVFAHVLEIFVVYARTVKPFIPALALLGGWALGELLAGRPQLQRVTIAALVLGAAFNFAPHFGRVFPREVEAVVVRHYGNPKRTLSIAGSLYVPFAAPVSRPDLALANAQLLYPVRSVLALPAGETLLRLAHPLAYKPFQYECHTPRERALVRQHDLSIRLIRLDRPAELPDHPPLSMLYLPEDYPTGR